MRAYQLKGLEWMLSMYDRGMSMILGDAMGLGKTLQTLSVLGSPKCARGAGGLQWGPSGGAGGGCGRVRERAASGTGGGADPIVIMNSQRHASRTRGRVGPGRSIPCAGVAGAVF